MRKRRGLGVIPGDVHTSSEKLILEAAVKLLTAETSDDIERARDILNRVLDRERKTANVIPIR